MTKTIDGLYGAPPRELAEMPAGAVQLSPLTPGAPSLEDARLASMTMLAPAGALERRYALALALRALEPGGTLTVMAPKDKGGSRLRKELEGFGYQVAEDARRHHRICTITKASEKGGLEPAIAEGGPRFSQQLGLWTQPGVFSWNRIDTATRLLMENLPPLPGAGADFGCGLGILAHKVLATPAVKSLALIDIDRRAIDCARRNVDDLRVSFHWADIADGQPPLASLDFVVMNPPFHEAGIENKHLGQQFIRRASQVLRQGGACWLVANRHLPYERVLHEHFADVRLAAEANGFKVFEVHK